jgi:hypothetical protein
MGRTEVLHYEVAPKALSSCNDTILEKEFKWLILEYGLNFTTEITPNSSR